MFESIVWMVRGVIAVFWATVWDNSAGSKRKTAGEWTGSEFCCSMPFGCSLPACTLALLQTKSSQLEAKNVTPPRTGLYVPYSAKFLSGNHLRRSLFQLANRFFCARGGFNRSELETSHLILFDSDELQSILFLAFIVCSGKRTEVLSGCWSDRAYSEWRESCHFLSQVRRVTLSCLLPAFLVVSISYNMAHRGQERIADRNIGIACRILVMLSVMTLNCLSPCRCVLARWMAQQYIRVILKIFVVRIAWSRYWSGHFDVASLWRPSLVRSMYNPLIFVLKTLILKRHQLDIRLQMIRKQIVSNKLPRSWIFWKHAGV